MAGSKLFYKGVSVAQGSGEETRNLPGLFSHKHWEVLSAELLVTVPWALPPVTCPGREGLGLVFFQGQFLSPVLLGHFLGIKSSFWRSRHLLLPTALSLGSLVISSSSEMLMRGLLGPLS